MPSVRVELRRPRRFLVDHHAGLQQPPLRLSHEVRRNRAPLRRRHRCEPVGDGARYTNLLALFPPAGLAAGEPGQGRVGVRRVMLFVRGADDPTILPIMKDLFRLVPVSKPSNIEAIRHFRVRVHAAARDCLSKRAGRYIQTETLSSRLWSPW